jgi:hypothetical protein
MPVQRLCNLEGSAVSDPLDAKAFRFRVAFLSGVSLGKSLRYSSFRLKGGSAPAKQDSGGGTRLPAGESTSHASGTRYERALLRVRPLAQEAIVGRKWHTS